jgi:Zn-dependent protease with chaperone function
MKKPMSRTTLLLVSIALAGAAAVPAAEKVELEGYAEWRHGDVLIVEGQRVRADRGVDFKGAGMARDFRSIPLGYETKVEGSRSQDGQVAAREVEAKPNGSAMFEGDLKAAFDQTESMWRQRGQVFEAREGGRVQVLGKLHESGPEVRRVRRITERLVPPYLGPQDFRVYVVDNEEWNAMAAPNGSIYVFDGLLDAMDDDEVAIILGHELVHATHEHSRKQFKKQIWIQLAALGAMGLADGIDSDAKRLAVQAVTMIGASAWSSGYGRKHEDQADRVGLRYAYEGGFDVSKGPGLWGRFAQKYGDSNKAVNFFFGSHSVARERQRNLERELQLNYRH